MAGVGRWLRCEGARRARERQPTLAVSFTHALPAQSAWYFGRVKAPIDTRPLIFCVVLIGCGANPRLQPAPVPSCENDLDGDGLPDVVMEESTPHSLRVSVALSSESFATFHSHALARETRLYRAPFSSNGVRLFAVAPGSFEVLSLTRDLIRTTRDVSAELPLHPSPLGLSIWPRASSAQVRGHIEYWSMEGGQLLAWKVERAETETPRLMSPSRFTSIEVPIGERAVQVGLFAANDSVHRYVVTLAPEEQMRLHELVVQGDALVAHGRPVEFGLRGRRPDLGQFGGGSIATRDGLAPGFFYSVAQPASVGALVLTTDGLISAFSTDLPYGGMAIASDFDGDGLQDLFVFARPDATMSGRRVDHGGETEFAVEGFPHLYAGIIMDLQALGDVDGDGRTDIAALWVDENDPYIEYWGILVHTHRGMRLQHQATLPERSDPLQGRRFL